MGRPKLPRVVIQCGQCGADVSLHPSRARNGARFCSKRCAGLARPAEYANQRHAKGYVLIYMPEHPRAASNGYVLEHIVIAERALGRPLPADALVHHADENPSNNGRGNLAILPDNTYHRALHARLNLKRLGANPFTEGWCRICREVKPLSQFGLLASNWNGYRRECRACRTSKAAA